MDVREVPEGDWPAAHALSREQFGRSAHPSADDEWRWMWTQQHAVSVGAYDGTRLVAHARIKPHQQWFGGRRVPMGGVASVAVTATHQRQGYGRALVGALLPRMRERGLAVSTLYPMTTPLYRSLGWDFAGDYTWVDVPGALLRALGPPSRVTLRPATLADLPGVVAAYDRLAAETTGLLDRDTPFVDRRPETLLGADAFLVAEGDGIEGYVRADRPTDGRHHVEVRAWDVVALTPEAERAVWFGLGAGASTARTVHARALPETVLPHLAEPDVAVEEHQRWMLRLVDLPAAFLSRGWPPDVTASVDLDVADDQIVDNSGRWRLAVEAGNATVTRGGDGTVALDARGLGALYTGYADPRSLRRAGRLTCTGERTLDALTAMFAGPRPRLLDYF